MIQIDYDKTMERAKEHLDALTNLIDIGCFKVRKIQLHQIQENTHLEDLIEITFPTRYDKLVYSTLEVFSRMNLESKRILYCVHLLGIKRKNLRSDNGTLDYFFGDPFGLYKKALLEFALTNEVFIAYKN